MMNTKIITTIVRLTRQAWGLALNSQMISDGSPASFISNSQPNKCYISTYSGCSQSPSPFLSKTT